MTLAPNVAPLAFDDVRDATRALRASGLRLSTPRRLVLEALFSAQGPFAAADLARELSIDESSVYRNLEVLEQHGLIRHVHLGHSPGLYTRVSKQPVEYLYCERCDKFTAVSPARLDPIRKQMKQRFGYTARSPTSRSSASATNAQKPGTPRPPRARRGRDATSAWSTPTPTPDVQAQSRPQQAA